MTSGNDSITSGRHRILSINESKTSMSDLLKSLSDFLTSLSDSMTVKNHSLWSWNHLLTVCNYFLTSLSDFLRSLNGSLTLYSQNFALLPSTIFDLFYLSNPSYLNSHFFININTIIANKKYLILPCNKNHHIYVVKTLPKSIPTLMKTKLFFFALICSMLLAVSLKAQKTYRTTVYKGNDYYVYPYKCQYNRYYRDSYEGGVENLIPVTDSLPNGQFISFYKLTDYKRRFLWGRYRVIVDTTKPGFIFTVRNGLRNGPAYLYDDAGILKSKGNYENDERSGIWQYYNDKGQLNSEVEYRNGFANGIYYSFYDNGNYAVVGQCSNDKAVGTWYSYRESGSPYSMLHFSPDTEKYTLPALYGKSEKFSIYNWFDESVEDFSFCECVNGLCERYNDNGTVFESVNFIHGHAPYLINKYRSNGKFLQESNLISNTGDSVIRYRVTYYDTAGIKDDETEKINYRTISYREYYKDGTLAEEEYYPVLSYSPRGNGRDTFSVRRRYYNGKLIYETKKVGLDDYEIIKEKDEKNFSCDNKLAFDKATGDFHITEYYYDPDSNVVFTKYETLKKLKGYPKVDSSFLFYEGKPYTGKMILQYNNRGYKEKLLIKKRRNVLLVKMQNGSAAARYFLNFFNATNNSYSLYSYSSKNKSENNFVEGKLEGLRTVYDRKHNVAKTEYYRKGRLNGEKCTYSYRYKDTTDNRRDRRSVYYLKEKENFKNDLLDSTQVYYNWFGSVNEISNYTGGKKNGKYTEFNKDCSVEVSAIYMNDSLEGKYIRNDRKGRILENYNYHDNKMTGVNYLYQHGDTVPVAEFHCNMGYFDGTSYEFYENTRVVKKTLECSMSDSIPFYYYREEQGANYKVSKNSNNYSSYYSYSHLPTSVGKITCYYKNGTKSIEVVDGKNRTDTTDAAYRPKYNGRISFSKKGDLWKFWDVSGNLVKQIDYYEMRLPNLLDSTKKDSIWSIGKITEWYGNGSVKTQGFVLNEESEYSCLFDNDTYTQDIYYTNYWSYTGEQIVKNGTGNLLTYHDNGKVQTMTNIRCGLKDGLYKEWDPDGHLTKLGHYKNGKKNGRWLSGDLEGMNYVNDQCFSSQEDFENAVRANRKNITIEETFYIDGESARSKTYHSYE